MPRLSGANGMARAKWEGLKPTPSRVLGIRRTGSLAATAGGHGSAPPPRRNSFFAPVHVANRTFHVHVNTRGVPFITACTCWQRGYLTTLTATNRLPNACSIVNASHKEKIRGGSWGGVILQSEVDSGRMIASSFKLQAKHTGGCSSAAPKE